MAEWKIVNGNLPFQDAFPEMPAGFDEYPTSLWKIVDGSLPYKSMFPAMYAIDDAPEALWKISDDLPFKTSFATRYPINEAPMALWVKEPDGLPYKIVFPKMPKAPVMEKLYEGEREIVLLSDYHQTVILSGYNQKIVIDETNDDVDNSLFRQLFPQVYAVKVTIPIYKQTIPVGKVLRSDPPG